MFGNLKGWLLSLVIVALTCVVIIMQGIPPRPSPPTGRFAFGMEQLKLPIDPTTIVPAGTKDADAGELYRKAAEHVRTNSRKYAAYEEARDPKKRKELAAEIKPAIDLLIEARDCTKSTLFTKPTDAVNYDNEKPYLPELKRLGTIGVAISGSTFKDDKARAAKILEAVFTMGRNLSNERLVLPEFMIGNEAMINAAGVMPGIMPDGPSRKSDYEGFVAAMSGYNKDKVAPLLELTGLPREGRMLETSGDVLLLARDSKEPMWKTEALLKAGRMARMMGVQLGDQIAARKLLKITADRTDLPANVKAAAVAGRDLDSSTFNKIGGGS